jgi:hypothetical protein
MRKANASGKKLAGTRLIDYMVHESGSGGDVLSGAE